MPPNHLAAAERSWKIAKGGYTYTVLDSILGENTMEGLFNEAKKVAALEAKLEACEAQNKKMREALEYYARNRDIDPVRKSKAINTLSSLPTL